MKKEIKPWRKLKSESGPDLILFRARYDWVENPRNAKVLKRIVLETNEWVNITAVTPDKKILLVKQFRFGSGTVTTEIPAGLIDQGEDSLMAARRELLEETGFTSEDWIYLGFVEPNPAFLNNRCHHWLARDVIKKGTPRLDIGEDIEVIEYTYDQLRAAIKEGVVNHVLALSALSRLTDFWQHMTQSDFG